MCKEEQTVKTPEQGRRYYAGMKNSDYVGAAIGGVVEPSVGMMLRNQIKNHIEQAYKTQKQIERMSADDMNLSVSQYREKYNIDGYSF